MLYQPSRNEELAGLSADRRAHVLSCNKNGDKSHELIASLYSDSSHFIYELLQNADDAGASEVRFTLDDCLIRFEHNGKKAFSFHDIESITTIGSSTKIEDVNSIGRFGAGFKSVFAITRSPRIHSEDYHFQIVDFIIPEEIADLSEGQDGWTRFELPFNNPDLPAQDARERLSTRLREIENESLLFLHHIKCIEWSTGSDHGLYLSSAQEHKVTLSSQINGQDSSDVEYTLSERLICIKNTELRLVVAYRLGADDKIVPVNDSKLFVFFPTNERTGFQFLTHAPYKTNPSRESIPFDDPENQEITESLSQLIADSIAELKSRDFLDQHAFSVFPINQHASHPLYIEAYRHVKWRLMTEALLPSSNGSFVTAKQALIPVEDILPSLLDANDIQALFGRRAWVLDGLLTNHQIQEYLESVLEIPEVSLRCFCRTASEAFFDSKSDDWMTEFYEGMTGCAGLYGYSADHVKKELRNCPFLRLEDNSCCPLVNAQTNKIQVYLASRGDSRFPTVKRSLASSKKARDFLIELGLKEPDDIAEVRDLILPKYRSRNIDEKEYLSDFSRILEILALPDKTQRDRLVQLLREKDSEFIRCMDCSDNISYKPAENVYFRTKNLISWFDDNRQDEYYFLKFPGEEIPKEARELLEVLGVRYNLMIDGGTSINVESYGYHRRSVDGFNPDFDIHGLEFALRNISLQRSQYLWDQLLKYTNKLKGHLEQRSNKNHPWEPGAEQTSVAFQLLSMHSWLYLQNEELIASESKKYSLDDLADDYTKNADNVSRLVELLGLKPNEIQEIEKKYNGKFYPEDKVAWIEECLRLMQLTDVKTDLVEVDGEADMGDQQTLWTPSIEADDAVVVELEESICSTSRVLRDLSGQDSALYSLGVEQEDPEAQDGIETIVVKDSSINSQDRKAIGDYGEKVAYKHLKDKYADNQVIWLNTDGNSGHGYDFVIKDGDADLFYYEVKSKTDESPRLFEISGVQWNWANKLYIEGRGDMYRILVVSNVGEPSPKIQTIVNPYRRWHDGELYADPVRIKL